MILGASSLGTAPLGGRRSLTAGGPVPLAAVLTGSVSLAAALLVGVSLASTIPGGAALGGSLAVAKRLSAALSSTATLTGALAGTHQRPLSANLAGTGNLAAVLKVTPPVPLAASLTGVATFTASLGMAAPFYLPRPVLVALSVDGVSTVNRSSLFARFLPMNLAGFFIKQGDTLPSVRVVLSDAEGPVDLTGCTVVFHLRLRGGGIVAVDRPCVVEDATAGVVRFDWQSGETAIAGTYEAEFEVVYPTGGRLTAPNFTQLDVHIRPQIA